PECWPWHPDLVEELLWLQQAWQVAYQHRDGSVAAAGDWHDRLRPGVARRIKQAAGLCSLDNHRPNRARHHDTSVAVPPAGWLELIADWWTARRDQPAPTPPPALLHSAG